MATKQGSAVKRSLEEHEGIRTLLDKLEGYAKDVRSKRAEMGETLMGLEAHLDRLMPILERHFALEENCGLHEEVVEALPNESPVIARLLNDHRRLLHSFGEVRGVTAILRCMVQSEEPLIHDRIAKLLVLMREHESQEHDLFVRAIEGDGQAPD